MRLRIGTIVAKVYKRIFSMIKKTGWKLLYGSAFHCGKGTCFYPFCHIVIDGVGTIKIGKHCFFNQNCSINSIQDVQIGNHCIFGENVAIYDHNHKFDNNKEWIRKQGFEARAVKIGDNCWIGTGTIILSGVTIGSNVVIGAGSLIAKSIPDNSIVVDKREQNIRVMGEDK